MSLKERFKKIRNDYVINQVKKVQLPSFREDETVRYRILFSGRVQKVGFRLEVCELAKRLELTGWCQNMENGDVLTEVQGPKNKIKFLVHFMESLKRIKIADKKIEKIILEQGEKEFLKRV